MGRSNGPIHTLFDTARKEGRSLLAVLIDPDKVTDGLARSVEQYDAHGVDVFLVGGSLLMEGKLAHTLACIKEVSDKPVYLFPSGVNQITNEADGILFLSLLSGRNPELLIGKHVEAAPMLAQTDLHVMSTGYLLIDSGNVTTAHYMSQSSPIPYDKDDIAAATALAGSYLGMQCIYMDGGSGAKRPISSRMISAVRKVISTPLIIGGGLRTPEQIQSACQAGADMVVIGTALEEDPSLISDISIAAHRVRAAID